MVVPNSLNYQNANLKFLCSYGGKILPRHHDGMLRYHGGLTRVLAVNRSISFSELMVKLGELCGSSVSLRCQLPSDDLDALVSIKSEEDLANLVEEYDRAAVTTSSSSSMKIRAFLSLPKKISPPTTTTFTSPKSPLPPPGLRKYTSYLRFPTPVDVVEANGWCIRRATNRPAGLIPVLYGNKSAGKVGFYANLNSAPSIMPITGNNI